MMHDRNNGKKVVGCPHCSTCILVDAIINTGPCKDSTRIGSQATVRRQAVDFISLLITGTREAVFHNVKTIAECLADELINAAKGSSNSYAI
ncbi:ribosomal protein S7 domain-containing protein [Phycomyces nitens]|nr:ribosomal protein S7 domain-containing protein [Phycomyces nitens]